MTREKLQAFMDNFTETSPLNYIDMADHDVEPTGFFFNVTAKQLSETVGDLKGKRLCDNPVFSIVDAHSPAFADLKRYEVAGEQHMLPTDFMPEAKTLISIFRPTAKWIVDVNKNSTDGPTKEWMFSRVEGARFNSAFSKAVRDFLRADGIKVIVPFDDETPKKPAPPPAQGQAQGYTAGMHTTERFFVDWSERHVGYVAGLGTFGLSTNFISKVGSAGYLLSMITDWDIEPDAPDYDDWLGYCSRCGACLKRCPVKAHYPDKYGKDVRICSGLIREMGQKYSPRGACGFCMTGVPCERTRMKAPEVS